MLNRFVVSLALLLGACSTAAPQSPGPDAERPASVQSLALDAPLPSDSAAATVDAFAAALRDGDRQAVERLLAPDAVIAEGGGAERSFAEYASHHMPDDMAFTAAVQFTLERREVIESGDAATIISQSQAHGEFHGRPVELRMMETMVLQRAQGAWRIVHIHWSSAPTSGEH